MWERLTRGVPNRASLTLSVLAGLYIGASIVMTRSPITFIATGMTLDSWTGFYRLQIWEHGLRTSGPTRGSASVWPTGSGRGGWSSPTVDAFWLVIAMRNGIPSFVLLVLGVGLLMRAVVTRGSRTAILPAAALGARLDDVADRAGARRLSRCTTGTCSTPISSSSLG